MPLILYEHANLWPCAPPSYFLVQNKNTSMFLAEQFFLPPPSLPYNVNEKCASQNRNRKDGKFLFIFSTILYLLPLGGGEQRDFSGWLGLR